MIRKILLIGLLLMALTSRAQETLLPDTTLHLPSLNNLGQMHYINRWPMSYGLMGYHDWDLHRGLNVNLGASNPTPSPHIMESEPTIIRGRRT